MSTIAFPQPLLTLSFSRSLSLSSNDDNDNIIITEIEQYYPNDVYGRAKLLCCSAAHQVNVAARLRLGGKGKRRASEYYERAKTTRTFNASG